ncbi:hypothetical protein Golomagni_00115 [Golovinomyces magnicellulatus]|nr:hypothetical protein Golomagni_00115 [Golovinomyces magnicellulatus]
MAHSLDMEENQASETYQDSNRNYDRAERFRFKKSSKRVLKEHKTSATHCEQQCPENDRIYHERRNKRRKVKHSSKSRNYVETPVSKDNDAYQPNFPAESCMDPEVAFRESLFDAMRDDEGAQFWEGVYGQPIHTYPNIKPGPDGELERMTDDDEEKLRRETAKKEREKLMMQNAEERRKSEKLRRKVEESIKRGNERALRKGWLEKWDKYLTRWNKLENESPKLIALTSIPWPVASGKYSDVNLKEIEQFFIHAPTAGQPSQAQLGKILKVERVRWHPDKIQQKLGGQDVNRGILQAVTSVFQVIDRLWSQIREENPKT